jgi:seryl-tRNA synthetase
MTGNEGDTMELFSVLDRTMATATPVGGDVVGQALDRKWIRPFATGQYLYGPEWTTLVRGLQGMLLATAARLGFAEWMFPRLIPRRAVDNFRLTQFAPELLLAAEGGQEILDPVQCLPVYHHLSGTRVGRGEVPMTIVETLGGWTWRNEDPHRLDGPIRAREFLRVEYFWLAAFDDAVALRHTVLDAVTTVLRELGLSVQLVVGEGCMDIPSVRATQQAASTLDEVPVIDIEIPLREPTPHPSAEPGPHKEDFEEIAGATVEGSHHLHDFDITSDVPDLASGCCGVGLNRLVVGFLYQHGFDPRNWPEPLTQRLVPERSTGD